MITPKMVFDEYAKTCGWNEFQKFFEEQPCDEPYKSFLQKLELCDKEFLPKLFYLAKGDKNVFEQVLISTQ